MENYQSTDTSSHHNSVINEDEIVIVHEKQAIIEQKSIAEQDRYQYSYEEDLWDSL